MRPHFGSSLVFALALLFGAALHAQQVSPPPTAVCDFDSTHQIAVEYAPVTVDLKRFTFGREIPFNRAWTPGGRPLTLFINHPVIVGDKELPVGAYTMFVIPSEKQWTLVVSRSTDTSGKYDEREDLARVPMQTGELSSAENEFSVYFAHEGPDRCSMRLDLAKQRAWIGFQEKK